MGIYVYESEIQERGLKWGYKYKFGRSQNIVGV